MANKDLSEDLAEVKIEGKIRDASATNPITSSQAWMEVGDVMSENVATIAPDQTVCAAANIMSERNIGRPCFSIARRQRARYFSVSCRRVPEK